MNQFKRFSYMLEKIRERTSLPRTNSANAEVLSTSDSLKIDIPSLICTN